METGAGNTVKDIDYQCKREGEDECLTCGARARSVVTMEAFRTQHGRAAKGKIESVMLDRGGVGTSCENAVDASRRESLTGDSINRSLIEE